MKFSKSVQVRRHICKENNLNKGMTLVETVAAMVIFTTMVASFLPLFVSYKATTMRNDTRLGALAVTRQVMDELRRVEPCHMPTTGTKDTYPTSSTDATCVGPIGTGASIANLTYKGKAYKVEITYCDPNTDCNTNSRRVRVRSFLVGSTDPLFQLETVYTKLTPPSTS